MKKCLGFTLIELLLVIAVLAIMASFAVMAIRREAIHNRVQKTAIQAQAVMQAAMAYSVNKEAWPAGQLSCDTMPSDISAIQTFVDDYLPNSSGSIASSPVDKLKSNLGVPYCFGPLPVQTEAGEPNVAASQFWVALKMPTGDLAFANQVKNRLPDAVLTQTLPPDSNSLPTYTACTMSSACYVISEIAQPGPTSNAEGGSHIIGTGHCLPGVIGNQAGSKAGVYCVDGGDVPGPTGSTYPSTSAAAASFNWAYSYGDLYQYTVHMSCPVGQTPDVTTSFTAEKSPLIDTDGKPYYHQPFFSLRIFSHTCSTSGGCVLKIEGVYTVQPYIIPSNADACFFSAFGPVGTAGQKFSAIKTCLGGATYGYNSGLSFDLTTTTKGSVGLKYTAFCKPGASSEAVY